MYPFDDFDDTELENDEMSMDLYGQQDLDNQMTRDNTALEAEFNATPAEQYSTPVVNANLVQPQQKLNSQAPMSATKTPVPDKYSSLMDEYSQLQKDRSSNFKKMAIVDALSQIGQAVAARHTPGYKTKSNMDLFEKMVNQPVQDYQDKIKQQGLDQQLKDLLKERDPNSAVAQQARKLAQARGYEVTPDMSSKDLLDAAKHGDPLKIRDEQQGLIQGSQKIKAGKTSLIDAEKMRDPNSSVSQFYRSGAMKRGFKPEEVEGKSAWDISEMIKASPKSESGVRAFQTKYVTDPVTGEIKYYNYNTTTGEMAPMGQVAGYAPKAIENKRTGETDIFSPALGAKTKSLTGPASQEPSQVATQEVPEVTRENLTVNQQKALDNSRKEFIDDTKDDRNSLIASKGIQNMLATGEKLDGDILRLIQNKFARASGERGAMTEQDVAPFGGRQEIVARIERSMSNWSQGKITPDDRKFLSSLASSMQKQTERDLTQRTQFFSNNLYKDFKSAPNFQNTQMTPKSIENLLGSDVYTNPNFGKVQVIEKATGKKGSIPQENVDAALASGKYELVK